mmetsp:Transcript_9184/g.13477  ORF Transcript_9184/g.13477 Transcript_9184/m.13477 type:complete len:158 (-) Transcript_9184:173-646(-)
MNLSATVAIALYATAGCSAYSFSSKGSKASSKAVKSKATKTKAAKAGSYSMSMSLPSCKGKDGLEFDTGLGSKQFDIGQLVTPEAGETFTSFSYSGGTDEEGWKCEEGDKLGFMKFTADNSIATDGTIADCTYEACYEEECAPECCCENIILIEVTD